MDDILEKTDAINNNFEKTEGTNYFMKEQITYFEKSEKIDFKECHVAISQNGGLIAICKKKSFLDISKGTKLNDNILIMYQDAKQKFFIPITWAYKERWIVCLEFNEDEKLYGICNDGTIYKFDIVTQRALLVASNKRLFLDNIIKAKLLMKGFVSLTVNGNFYYTIDIKKPNSTLILIPDCGIQYSNDIDFLCLPPDVTNSGKIELFLTNSSGNGIFQIILKNPYEDYKPDNSNIIISFINENIPEPYSSSTNYSKSNSIGKINCIALSPSKNQIAFYNSDTHSAYVFPSTFESPRKKIVFNTDETLMGNEKDAQEAVLSFKVNCQFLFCGEDALALSGLKYILISGITEKSKTIIYTLSNRTAIESLFGREEYCCKCITEVDGIRYLTNEGTFLVSKVSKELYNICYIFSEHSGKKLLSAYKNYIDKKPYCDKDIRQLAPELPEAIYNLQIASANLFWLEDYNKNKNNDEKKDRKLLQLEFLRAAQYGKTFLQREEFDFDKFNDICKDIKIINNLRNHPWQPRYITYEEYKSMNNLIPKLLSQQNFSLSFKLAPLLNFDTELIYQKYAISNIKRLPIGCSKEEEEKLYTILYYKLKDIPNISYLTIAKKAFKYDKNEIGMKFLEHEKSILTKIPQYIEHCKWDKALSLAYETCDKNVIRTVLDKMIKIENLKDFTSIIDKHPKIQQIAIEFLKDYNKNNITQKENYQNINNEKINFENFLKSLKNKEEYLFFLLEKFFKTDKINERKKCIRIAKEIINNKIIDKPNFDYKFYKNYLNDLDNSLKFKIDCMDKKNNIIKKTVLDSFDNSIYDCYQLGIKADKYDWIETQNKKLFELGNKKLLYLRLRNLAENGKFTIIEDIIKKYTLKKMGLSPINIAEIYYEFKEYDRAVEYIKQIKDGQFFHYRVEMLKAMDKYVDALEVIITDSEGEKMILINDILKKRPDLTKKAEELYSKYGK
jgi:hypothetical protein